MELGLSPTAQAVVSAEHQVTVIFGSKTEADQAGPKLAEIPGVVLSVTRPDLLRGVLPVVISGGRPQLRDRQTRRLLAPLEGVTADPFWVVRDDRAPGYERDRWEVCPTRRLRPRSTRPGIGWGLARMSLGRVASPSVSGPAAWPGSAGAGQSSSSMTTCLADRLVGHPLAEVVRDRGCRPCSWTSWLR